MNEKPEFLSIGMPAHNEEESIQRSLKWVLNQTLWKNTPPNQREIIVCANSCTDKTVERVGEMQKFHPEIKLIEIPQKSKALAWNRIVKKSNRSAKVVFFTDADVVLHRRALEGIWQRFRQNPRLELVAGNPVPININESRDPIIRARNLAIKRGLAESTHLSGALYGIKRSTASEIEMPENLIVEDLYLRLIVPNKNYAKEFSARAFFKPAQTRKDIMLERRRYDLGRKQLIKMDLLPKGVSIIQRAQKLKGLSLKQKIARIYFFSLGKISALNPLNKFRPVWRKIKSSKIPKRKRTTRKR